MEFWMEVIKQSLTATGIAFAVAWMLQKVIEQYFSSKLEEHKHILESKLEEHKHLLERENTRFKIQYEKLHVERAETVKEVYKKIVFMSNQFESWLRPIQLSGEETSEEKRKKAGDSYNSFSSYFEENKIFFDKVTADKIEEYRLAMRGIWSMKETSTAHKAFGERHLELKAWREAYDSLEKKAIPIKSELEKDFRKIIGI